MALLSLKVGLLRFPLFDSKVLQNACHTKRFPPPHLCDRRLGWNRAAETEALLSSSVSP